MSKHKEVLQDIKETLYGQNMEILGWHLNGNTEPFDSFADENGWFDELDSSERGSTTEMINNLIAFLDESIDARNEHFEKFNQTIGKTTTYFDKELNELESSLDNARAWAYELKEALQQERAFAVRERTVITHRRQA